MTQPSDPPTFFLQSVGIRATAQPRGGRFVVLAGSQARAEVVDSYERNVPAGYRAHRERLIAEGVLQHDQVTGELQFMRDEAFNGSTEAGCVVAGRMVNGIRDWFVQAPDGAKQSHADWLTQVRSGQDTPIFTLKTDQLKAYAQMQKGEFVVLTGSEAMQGVSDKMDRDVVELKEHLIAQGALVEKPDSDLLEFIVDTTFKGAAAASGVILLRRGFENSLWIFTDSQGQEVSYGKWMGITSKIPPQVRQARLGLTQTASEETGMLEAHGHREEILADVVTTARVPLNQILYGPPGTGKTFQVVERALAVLDPAFLAEFLQNRAALKARYDDFVTAGAVSFVTFHQSFGYEDFVEGIKPVMEGSQLKYRIEDGIFLEAVRAAGGQLAPAEKEEESQSAVQAPQGPPAAAQVWRIYIDGAAPSSQLRERCLERGEVRVGSWNKPPQDLTLISSEELNPSQVLFRDGMRVGDLILLATNSDQIGAVGVVDGEYHFNPGSDPIFALNYAHARSVRWLATDLKVGAQAITGRRFAPPTLQRVAGATAAEIVQRLGLSQSHPADEAEQEAGTRPHVLIIDEINRGNVAKIFGELITLLETEKRAGGPEALTVKLPLSRRALSVPDSLYVIGTMNTADRSLTQLDTALRRRFVFHPVWPEPSLLQVVQIDGQALDLRKFLYAINDRIERLLSREQVIGHAYLLGLPATLAGVASALRERILPQLEEHFFDDWSKIREVLADAGKERHLQFVQQDKVEDGVRYRVNESAFREVEAFTLVYSRMNDDAFPFKP
ncbi:AAA family ATPase [Deinococcus sp. QL22]|uniref:AAA family ATPase n=1 Tax=Deinococcus sp. QL22 TaxID=2939437 RepID=UPI0020170AC3|nr:AAA family ATPase [Deinococcus sp. QL22]UQN08784.1 AAA family ATPase [Deinococcus sp. QL22]